MAKAKLKFYPSASKRWINCPGSVRLSAGQTQDSTTWSQEGSAAHQLAEDALNGIMKGPGVMLPTIKMKPEYEEFHDPGMDAAVQRYVDFISGKVDEYGAELKVEEKFKLKVSGSMISGIADAVVISDVFSFFGLYDYKHGEGMVVDVEHNSQLMIGALAFAKTNPDFFNEKTVIELGIIQPRTFEGNGIKLWQTTINDLLLFEQEVLFPAVKSAKLKKPQLATGEWCKFCPVEKCPKVIEEAKQIAILQYEKTPYDLSYDELYKVLHFVDNVLPSWVKKVKSLALKKALDGQDIPGYKLVGSITRESWIPGAKDDLIELAGEKVLKHSLKTPKQVLNMIEDDETKEVVQEMIVKADSVPKIAADTDRRKVWQEPSAFDEFEEFLDK